MRNPITKLATAAAAAIIIVVALGLFEFTGDGTTSSVVWAEVARKVQGHDLAMHLPSCSWHDGNGCPRSLICPASSAQLSTSDHDEVAQVE